MAHPTSQRTVLDAAWVERLSRYATVSDAARRPDRLHVVVTPMTGTPLARLPLSAPDDVVAAFAAARSAQPAWAGSPVRERARVLLRFHDLVLDRQQELLDLIQLESGKARLHAFDEIADVASVARFYGKRAPSILAPRRLPGALPGLTRVIELAQPYGVAGIVSPWNYPLSMGITDALPALVAGNAVVLRPDLQASLTALAAAELLADAGLPTGVLQVVLGAGAVVGAEVLERADVVTFTGSTGTGRAIAADAGERLTPITLELGGKNALYVADDADLDRAVPGALRACFASAGQLCISTERILLHESIAEAFLARFVPAVAALRLGTVLTYAADVGSLTGPEQLARVTAHVEDARSLGARVLTGGRARPDVGPYCYEPTVLDGVTAGMTVCREETFGPVVSIYRVGSDGEAIALANDSAYGLSASVWTRDRSRGAALAASIAAGAVNINEGYAAAYGSSAAPMGGVKASGLGRRHGAAGLLKYTQAKSVAEQRGIGFGVPLGMRPDRYAALLTSGLRVMRYLRRS